MNLPNVFARLFRTRRITIAVAFSIGLVSCSGIEKNNAVELKDISNEENVYTAATLDEYKALYSLENYLTDADAETMNNGV